MNNEEPSSSIARSRGRSVARSRRVASSRTSFFSFFLSFLCRFFASFATPDAFVLSLSPPRTTLSYAALGIARARGRGDASRRSRAVAEWRAGGPIRVGVSILYIYVTV